MATLLYGVIFGKYKNNQVLAELISPLSAIDLLFTSNIIFTRQRVKSWLLNQLTSKYIDQQNSIGHRQPG
ncbi:MAG: hypothetical protein ACI9C4_000675 [Paraglaciecola sp.]|jgi:hypothetical protein